MSPVARIGDVARRHGIHPGQIRLWRQSFSYADRPTVFLPVEITDEVGVSQPTTAATRPAIVEILLRNGRRLKVSADVELKLLGQLVACVEAHDRAIGNVRVYLASAIARSQSDRHPSSTLLLDVSRLVAQVVYRVHLDEPVAHRNVVTELRFEARDQPLGTRLGS